MELVLWLTTVADVAGWLELVEAAVLVWLAVVLALLVWLLAPTVVAVVDWMEVVVVFVLVETVEADCWLVRTPTLVVRPGVPTLVTRASTVVAELVLRLVTVAVVDAVVVAVCWLVATVDVVLAGAVDAAEEPVVAAGC